VKLDLENIEELFSLASASEGGQIDAWMRLAIGGTLDFALQTGAKPQVSVEVRGAEFFSKPLPEWVRTKEVRPHTFKCSAYSFYLARLLGCVGAKEPKGKNTFVTFNYDTVLEEALKELKLPYGYGWGHGKYAGQQSRSDHCPPPLELLKLHGSVNWGRERDNPSLKIVEGRTYSELIAEGYIPELLPPTWSKAFGQELREVWARAVASLRLATRVIVIGFSMPATDAHFKYLLAAGLKENISLRNVQFVAPNAKTELKQRASAMLRDSYIDKGLIDFVDRDLFSFVSDDGFMCGIGRPAARGSSPTSVQSLPLR
jgi:hypothetical protein